MILAKKSMGAINVIYIDDIYPLFDAPRGTFAFNTNGDHFVSNGKIWYRMLEDSYGTIFHIGDTFNFGSVAANQWTLGAPITYSTKEMSKFKLTDDYIIEIENNLPIRTIGYSTTQLEQSQSSPLTNWDIEICLSHVTGPTIFLSGKAISGESIPNTRGVKSMARTNTIQVLNPDTDDGFCLAFRRTTTVNNRTYLIPDKLITTLGYDKAYLYDESNFKGTFEDENWVTVQDGQTNQWHLLSNGAYDTQSASISNDGINQTYDETSTSISHLYKDIQLPEFINGLTISFAWKCLAEVGYDYGTIWIIDDSYTPTAGISNSGNAILVGRTRFENVENWRKETSINLSGSILETFRGKKLRLIFQWQNDDVIGNNPPFCIDDIQIYYFIGGDERTLLLNETFIDLTNWTTVQDLQTNYWIAGTNAIGVYQNGGNGLYITDNNSNAQYSNTTSVSHIYIDIEFPSDEINFAIDFMWKCEGEENNDYGRFYLLETTDTLEEGSLPDSQKRIGDEYYNQKGTTWNYEKIYLNDDIAGTTKRLVCSWVNNETNTSNPGMCISNLKVFSD